MKTTLALLTALLLAPLAALHAAYVDVPAPAHLQCERAENPVIDVAVPALSWKLTDNRSGAAQTAYRILVASSPEPLAADQGDLWDSGRVEGDQSVDVAYAGQPLASRQQAFWKVKVWDQNGKESSWSEPALWRMGLLNQGEWKAQWITAPKIEDRESDALENFLNAACSTPRTKNLFRRRHPVFQFRKPFSVKGKVTDAIARVCGLGAFNLYVNGTKAGNALLDPINNDYDRLAYYKTFDIASLLKPGDNVIAIEVADGFYGQGVVWGGSCVYGFPKLLAEVEWQADGKQHSLATDTDWKVTHGPTRRTNIYAGEFYDARMEQTGWKTAPFDDGTWTHAVTSTPGTPRLVSQVAPSIEPVRSINPAGVSSPAPGVWVFDFGQNFSGVARMHFHEMQPGQVVTVQFGDFLEKNGRVSHSVMGACQARQTQTYVCRGGSSEKWAPSFTYFGFRYAEVTGLSEKPDLDLLEGVFLRTAAARTGQFECSLQLYNKMHSMSVLTQESNIHGVIEDCPHREKCGWLGDAWHSSESWLLNLDLTTFNRKFFEDIRTTYAYGNPDLPADVAGGKRMHLKPGPMLDWMVATIILPWTHYVYNGDRQELEQHYPWMTRFADTVMPMLRERYASGQLDLKRKERFLFGDWLDIPLDGRLGDPTMFLFPSETPAMLGGSQAMIHGMQCLAATAESLGRAEDRTRYAAMADDLIQLANKHYFDPATASYGSQTANAWAWKLGMVPEASREAFRQRFGQEIMEVDQGRQTCGQLGLAAIFPSLTEAGHGELVHVLASTRGERGIRAMIDRGATTLWEGQGLGTPVPTASGNHPSLSGYDTWFYQYLCGIRLDPRKPGFKHILLKPWFDPKVEWAKASVESPYGAIGSEWKRQPDGTIEWSVTVPPNTTAVAEAPQKMQFADDTSRRDVTAGSHRWVLSEWPGWQ
jgi:alpha-L-rhamnosidase